MRSFLIGTNILDPRVYGFNEDGSFRFVIDSRKLQPQPFKRVSNHPSDLTVTKQGNFALVNHTNQCEIFDITGNQVGSFKFAEKSGKACCIASNSKRDLFIGITGQQVVAVLSGDDFTFLRKICVRVPPSHIAVNSRDHCCIVYEAYGQADKSAVVGYDDSGEEVFTINPKIWGKAAQPLGVVYDADDTLLLGMYDFRNERGGHVHHYSKTGKFLKCVLKGIDKPNCLTIRNDTLAIADERSVLFYKKEKTDDHDDNK